MTPEHLYVRVDASREIGIGHFMRCLALTEHWRDQGGHATFIGICPASLRRRLENEGIRHVDLEAPHPDPADLERTAASIPPSVPVVIDGYPFDAAYQKRLGESGRRVMVIDDAGHLPAYEADLLLNQNIGAERIAYPEAPAMRLLGPEYVLLRREFLRWVGWHREVTPVASNLLVTLGGGDAGNYTVRVAEALTGPAFRRARVRIVTGPDNPHGATLSRLAEGQEGRFQVLSDVSCISEQMAWADLAISAGGTTCWELAFMGLPSVLITVADNQEAIVAGMKSREAAIDLGAAAELEWDHLGRVVEGLLRDQEGRRLMSENGRRMIDGRGPSRVVAALKRPSVAEGS